MPRVAEIGASSGMALPPIPALKIGYFNPNRAIRALARGVGMLTTPCAASGRLSVPRPVTAAAVVKNSRRLDDMGILQIRLHAL